jgi:hypothetical protein
MDLAAMDLIDVVRGGMVDGHAQEPVALPWCSGSVAGKHAYHACSAGVVSVVVDAAVWDVWLDMVMSQHQGLPWQGSSEDRLVGGVVRPTCCS